MVRLSTTTLDNVFTQGGIASLARRCAQRFREKGAAADVGCEQTSGHPVLCYHLSVVRRLCVSSSMDAAWLWSVCYSDNRPKFLALLRCQLHAP